MAGLNSPIAMKPKCFTAGSGADHITMLLHNEMVGATDEETRQPRVFSKVLESKQTVG